MQKIQKTQNSLWDAFIIYECTTSSKGIMQLKVRRTFTSYNNLSLATTFGLFGGSIVVVISKVCYSSMTHFVRLRMLIEWVLMFFKHLLLLVCNNYASFET
jgi:hypothetical protein